MLERLKEFIGYKKLAVRKFEIAVGMSNGTVHNAMANKSSISSAWLSKIAAAYPELNLVWLVTGKGDMLNGKKAAAPRPKEQMRKIPYFNVDFSGGFIEQYNDQTQNPSDFVVDRSLTDADFWCNLKGHSMEPTICDGERIALKPVDVTDPIKWGSIYAVVTSDGLRTVKRIEKSDEDGLLELVADNKEFNSQKVAPRNITHIFKVVAHMGLL